MDYHAIQAGYGVDLDPFEVLELVREHISARIDTDGMIIQDDADLLRVDPNLLHLLARPFSELQTRP